MIKGTYIAGLSSVTTRDLCATHQNLKVCILGALNRFSYTGSPDGLNSTFLLQGNVLEMAPKMKTVGGRYIPMPGREVRSLR